MTTSRSPRSPRRKGRNQAPKPVMPAQDCSDNPPISPDLVQSVETFFANHPKIQKRILKYETGNESVEGIASHFHKMSRKNHLEALALAYCIWIKSEKSGAYRNFVYEAERRRDKIDKRVTTLRIILENVISFGDDTEKGMRDAQRMYSRDEAAIRYLADQGIGPDRIKSEADKDGFGLDKWSKSWSKIRKERQIKLEEHPELESIVFQENSRTANSGEYNNITIELSYTKNGSESKTEKFLIASSEETDQMLVHFKVVLDAIRKKASAFESGHSEAQYGKKLGGESR